jgi:hypothetical protein
MDRINQAFVYLRNRVSELFSEEKAQDTLEYILIIGAVSVAVVIALLALSPGDMVDASRCAIAGITTDTGATPFAAVAPAAGCP